MSAAANAAAFLSLRGKLRPNPVHADRHAVAMPAAAAEPRLAPEKARAVRITYRKGRLLSA
jgi:hypothetical protein